MAARLKGDTDREKIELNSIPDGNGCWIWQRAKRSSGYGLMTYQGRMISAHRVSYEVFVGPIPDGLEIDHQCEVRECVNPAHLTVATHADNTNRGSSPPAINSRKTHCINGHAFTEENTFRQWLGGRGCRQCRRDRHARYYAEGRYR